MVGSSRPFSAQMMGHGMHALFPLTQFRTSPNLRSACLSRYAMHRTHQTVLARFQTGAGSPLETMTTTCSPTFLLRMGGDAPAPPPRLSPRACCWRVVDV